MRRILSRPGEGRPRIDDVRQVIEAFDEFPNDLEIEVVEHDVADGYTAWAPTYDGPNPLIEAEEPELRAVVRSLGPAGGRALDAGCGTGRHAEFLAALGYDTIGVDATPGMLDVARVRVPDVELREGRLEALPVADESVDLAIAALAVCHVPDLEPVLRELARVVRPGGSVVISDPHPTTVALGGVAGFRPREVDPAEGFTLRYVLNLHHPLHTYVNAAVAAGLRVEECREPTFPESAIEMNPAYGVVPAAVRQAFDGLPFVIIWRFRKPV